jgi:hypothetical protein
MRARLTVALLLGCSSSSMTDAGLREGAVAGRADGGGTGLADGGPPAEVPDSPPAAVLPDSPPAAVVPDSPPAAPPAIDAPTTPPPPSPPPPSPPPPSPPPPSPPPYSFRVLGPGLDFLEASSDQGGNVWGATATAIYFFRGGAGAGLTFDQSSGLAQGRTTWVDSYWFGTSPSTQPVSFTSVAGGMAGEAFVGNVGYIGDRLRIDPVSGTVEMVEGLAVTSAQQPDPTELTAQQVREVTTLHAVVDLNGPLGGAVWFGGWHGTGVLHGLTRDPATAVCGCADYEEHVHPFSPDGDVVYGGDVRGLAVTPEGDLWIGDKKALYFLPQGSAGSSADLFQLIGVPGRPDLTALDVFPGVDDQTSAIALDGQGGLYVASMANGLAYLAPGSYAPTIWTQADALPSSSLTGVAVDGAGDVWIATHNAGVVRYTPSANRFVSITTDAGLPSNKIRALALDRYGSGPRTLYVATENGIAVYDGP